jgi:hypothetical protein
MIQHLYFPWTSVGTISNWKNATNSSNSTGTYDFFFQLVTRSLEASTLSNLLDAHTLEEHVQARWRAFWGFYLHRRLREDVPSNTWKYIDGAVFATSPRVVVDVRVARILEGLLGAVLAAVLWVSFRMRNPALHKAPFSLAAQMGILAGSRLLELSEIVQAMQGKADGRSAPQVDSWYRVRLGWWRRYNNLRYGIDVEIPGEDDVDGNDSQPLFVNEQP